MAGAPVPPPGPPPVPPPPPGPPPGLAVPRGRNIRDESAPAVDHIKIGLEIEGIGSYRTNWNVPAVIAQPNFHDVFKRMPLVRSNSFNLNTGVAIMPEDGGTFGETGPAELVSQPHILNRDGLIALRNSIWKAIRKPAMSTSRGSSPFQDPRAPVLPAPLATTRWGKYSIRKVGGSLQVTIGVSVGKLLHTVQATRRATSAYLIGDATKRAGFNAIVDAAIAAEQYLTGAGQPFHGVTPVQLQGVRLMLLMSLLPPGRGILPGAGWGKDTFGCNIKAQTSFKACGIENLQFPFLVEVMRQTAAVFRTGLLNALAGAGVSPGLIAILNANLDPLSIGKAGQSAQTAIEGWYAIPNFLVAGNLHCVIEIRESDAPINTAVQTFLNTAVGTSAPQPTTHDNAQLVTTAAAHLFAAIRERLFM